jgi:streptogramin lyase
MKNHKQRDILLALALTLGVGLLLYFLARPEETPRIVSDPLHASWWDSFNTDDWIAETAGAPFNPDGIQLSRIHDLPDAFISRGVLTSTLIQPHALMMTHTVFSGLPALAWGNDGALYGVSNGSPGIIRYDPQTLESTTFISLPLASSCLYCESQVIAADSVGRVVAGIVEADRWTRLSSAMVAIYDPEQNNVVTTTIPISGANTMKALVSAPDGSFYGSYGLSIGNTNGADHLFRYDPALGVATDLGVPFTNFYWNIRALAVAPDGKVYGGGGPILKEGSFYYYELSSPGSRLFVYDPATQTFSYPGSDKVSSNRIRALLAGPDGKIYIGMEIGEEKGLHIYDPATNQWTYRLPGADVVALTWGTDGLVYGSTAMHVFTYDPNHPGRPLVTIGKLNKAGFKQLLAGPDGVIYGIISSYDSFDSSSPELIAFRTDCATGRIGTWDRVTWEADTPRGTAINIDVLDEKGNVLVRDIRNGGSLAGIDPLTYPSLRLRATLTTRDPQVSPVLKSWQVEYTFECQ